MIYTERTIKIKNGVASMDSPIVLYRGDDDIDILFTVIYSKPKFQFKFSGEKGNYIEDTGAKWGQLAIDVPESHDIFSEILECNNGTIIFRITGEMIDEIEEVGAYSFHIRLFDESRESKITIPPVIEGIIIKEPLIIEDDFDN